MTPLDPIVLFPRSESDSAWKDILDVYFKEFMQFFCPEVAKKIDWDAGYEMLDKELQAITTESMVGKRLVDKLIKIKSLANEEKWVLVHVEVQGERESDFERRLFEYHYRLYDRYRKSTATIVILADNSLTWRPEAYQEWLWGLEILTFRFVTIKLLDYEKDRADLETTRNPFGIVVLAHLTALTASKDEQVRFVHKFQLTRLLYERGLNRDEVFNLYKFIDWVITLPAALEIAYNERIHQLEKEHAMPYITTAERIGMQQGFEKGILEGKQIGQEEGIKIGLEEGKQAGLQEGRQVGLQEGRQVGLQEGRQVGLQEGRQVGLQEGRQVGLQEGRQVGLQEGRQVGLQEGKQVGEYVLLMRLLRHKFGVIPAHYQQRIIQADAETLLCWGEKVLEAQTVEEIFVNTVLPISS